MFKKVPVSNEFYAKTNVNWKTIEEQIQEFNAQPEECRTMNTENEKKHLEWPFYKDAEAYREAVRKGQILKGAHKYPEPFTTASWSNEQLLEHAMQENVDQAHYIYAAAERMRELESKLDKALSRGDYYKKELEHAKEILRSHGNYIRELKEEVEKGKAAIVENCNLRKGVDQIIVERDEWKKRAVKAEMDVTDLEFKLKQAKGKIQEPAHLCYENQVIRWGLKENKLRYIQKIHCDVCNKILFGE